MRRIKKDVISFHLKNDKLAKKKTTSAVIFKKLENAILETFFLARI